MNQISNIFFKGLITIIPIAITIYIVKSTVVILDSFLGSILEIYLNKYIPGLGLIATLILIFIFGLLLNNFFTAKLLGFIEKNLLEVPLIRAVYSPLRDLMNLFSKQNNQNLNHVVLVQLGDKGAQALGLLTRENFIELKLGTVTQDKVAVYFPFSYALGGITVLVNRSQIQEIDIPVEKAMSLALTAWIKADNKNGNGTPGKEK